MKAFATKMGLEDEDIQLAETLGAVHDLGKLKVSEELFRKLQAGGTASDEERESLKAGPEVLLEMVGAKNLEGKLRTSIDCMNCRFDGKGDPDIKGESIPILSRMLMIVNYQDMLTRQRTGRNPLSDEQVEQILRNNAGLIFDPTLVEVFLDA